MPSTLYLFCLPQVLGSSMANSACLNKRLWLALIQTSSRRNPSLHSPGRLPRPKDWIRSITSSSTKYSADTPGVSFGKENDEAIAPYLQRSIRSPKTRKRKTIEVAQSDAGDDYEIGGFIDRSKLTTQEVRAPSTNASDALFEDNSGIGISKESRRPDKRDIRAVQGHKTRAERISPSDRDTTYRQNHARRLGNATEHRSASASSSARRPLERKRSEGVEQWMTQKNALKEKFEEGWNPRKKLSPDAMEGIRGLHEQDPIKYSTDLLADQFKMSPEAIRRILKSKWMSRQSPEKVQERRERWAKRHDRIWDAKAQIGLRPPRRKDKEVEDPDKFEQDLERRRILGEM